MGIELHKFTPIHDRPHLCDFCGYSREEGKHGINPTIQVLDPKSLEAGHRMWLKALGATEEEFQQPAQSPASIAAWLDHWLQKSLAPIIKAANKLGWDGTTSISHMGPFLNEVFILQNELRLRASSAEGKAIALTAAFNQEKDRADKAEQEIRALQGKLEYKISQAVDNQELFHKANALLEETQAKLAKAEKTVQMTIENCADCEARLKVGFQAQAGKEEAAKIRQMNRAAIFGAYVAAVIYLLTHIPK